MTCLWQHPASKNGDTARLCGNEGHPFCTEHQFIADVLEETESVTREICKQRETALTAWQAQLCRLRLLVEHADELTPFAFVKRIHELLPELHQEAMVAVVYTFLTSGLDEESR
jgi:hypothetical protein